MIADLSAHRPSIHLTASYAPPPESRWARRRSGRPALDFRYAGPFGGVAALLFASATVLTLGGWFRGPSIVALFAIVGALAVLSIVLLWPVERPGPSPSADEPVRGSGHDSAFVCGRCAEYVPPPDWEALLRESGPADELGDVRTVVGPVLSPDLGMEGRWSLPAVSTLSARPPEVILSAPETSFVLPIAGGPVEYAGSVPDAHARRPRARSSRASTPAPLPRWAVYDYTDPSGSGGSESGRTPIGEAAERLSLEGWILAEVDGLMRGGMASFLGSSSSTPDEDIDSQIEALRGVELSLLSSCAVCKQTVRFEQEPVQCPDCRRPVCAPCRDRVVEHEGGAWCAPCAINRLSEQFLGVLEDEVPRPAEAPDVGFPAPEPGGTPSP